MQIGYARVSKENQNLEYQVTALKKAGCEKVFTEKVSASKERPELKAAIEFMRPGDTLVVWKSDRVSRGMVELVTLLNKLHQSSIKFKSLTEQEFDFTTSDGILRMHFVAMLNQHERDKLIERTKAGLEAARARGRMGGRKRKMTDQKFSMAQKLLNAGEDPKQVAASLGVSVKTLYRWCPGGKITQLIEAPVKTKMDVEKDQISLSLTA
jgi:DNA invertase Pin-like site-specific DNA recombinase